ncbi:MAG TPA: YXWGXW repeat-containing protein [Bryobacteraceae bacterium]|nr:YXWGXW repeat-containing protein [Bryobacteraceae bacterium]
MKTKLLGLVFLAGTTLFARPHVFFGVGFGYAAPAPVAVYAAPPAPIVAYATPAPGPGYTWIGGYWYPAGPRWAWHSGYWVRPPFARAYWVAPRYYGRHFYGGYWRR